MISPLTFSHYGRRVDGPLFPALPRERGGGSGQVVGQRDADDGHGLVPRPVAVRVRADDLGSRDVGLFLGGEKRIQVIISS